MAVPLPGDNFGQRIPRVMASRVAETAPTATPGLSIVSCWPLQLDTVSTQRHASGSSLDCND